MEDDHIRIVSFALVIAWSLGQHICSPIGTTLQMVNLDVIVCKFQYFPCYSPTDLLGVSPVLQIEVVQEHLNFMQRASK
jgi:hypothetical protein